MRRLEIEIWARQVVDAVGMKRRVEDDRVEVKRAWPDHEKAARRIAGHANSMRGENILWVIGLDEEKGVVTGSERSIDPSTWWAQTKKHFDEGAPALFFALLTVEDRQVAALLFDTEAYPFVIKDSSGRQAFDREVPWRDGTSVRSAHRSELLKLLYQRDNEPRFDVMDAAVDVENQGEALKWRCAVEFYARVSRDAPLTLAFHDTEVRIEISDLSEGLRLSTTKMYPPQRFEWSGGGGVTMGPRHMTTDSLTISKTDSELFLEGPGKFYLRAELISDLLPGVGEMPEEIVVQVMFKDVVTSAVYRSSATLSQTAGGEGILWTRQGETTLLR